MIYDELHELHALWMQRLNKLQKQADTSPFPTIREIKSEQANTLRQCMSELHERLQFKHEQQLFLVHDEY